MERWTIPDILNELRKTRYPGQTDYYIKKHIGIKYNITKVNKQELLNELIPALTHDNIYEIVLRSDDFNLCFTNKKTAQLCHSEQFWKDKFNYAKLPWVFFDLNIIIAAANEYAATHGKKQFNNYINDHDQYKPDTIQGWIDLYNNIKLYKHIATLDYNH